MIKKFILLLLLFPMLLQAQSSDLFPMVPGVPVVHSPKSSGIFRGTPSLVRLPTGELLASNDVFSNGSITNRTDIFISRNNGETWSYKATVPGAVWSGLFVHNGKVYLMGGDTSKGANFVIRTSADKGTTWSAPTVLIPGSCHGSSTPVLRANGRVYKAYEHHLADTNNKWMSGNQSFIISAPDDADLMNKDSWTVTDELSKPAWIDGTGWLESNAVIGRDGKVRGISRLASIEGIYAGCYTLESDSKIDESSARKIQFYGGASKFNIHYDPKTDLYYSLTNYVPEALQGENISAGGLRCVLALTTSYDLEEWAVKAIVLASTDVEKVGFQYVDWLFDGDDILFASRTSFDDGMGGADNFHNSNFMTFHRITDYATVTTPVEWEYLMPDDGWNGVVKPIDESNGKGSTPENPILISHPGQMVTLSEQVYQGKTYEGRYFLMTKDLDLNYNNWLPIGWYVNRTTFRAFSGHFDGGGHRILNLKIGRHDDVYTSSGVFGYTLGGSVSNLGLDGDSHILVGGASGGIVSQANATVISNCYNAADILGTSQAAGILGYGTNSPSIINCYNKGKIYLGTTLTTNKFVGGIFGYMNNTATVRNCYNVGEVTGLFSQEEFKGGIAGSFAGTVQNCYYSDGSIADNGIGTSKPLTDMKTPAFLSLMNGAQQPSPWKADFAEPINNRLPLLAWESDPVYQGMQGVEKDREPVLHLCCYPNPVSGMTRFSFLLDRNAGTRLDMVDLFGKRVATLLNDQLTAGEYQVDFDASVLEGGIYFFRLVSGEVTETGKLIVR